MAHKRGTQAAANRGEMTLTSDVTRSYATPTCIAETIRRSYLYSVFGTIAPRLTVFFVIVTAVVPGSQLTTQVAITPGSRVLMDAHNCYPYRGQWTDRIERALKTGTPLAIEQDLFWYTDPHTRQSQSLVTHGKPIHGNEPTMHDYFFERIRPLMEAALQQGDQGDWPLVTLNLDFKSDAAAHHSAVWKLAVQY